MELYRLRWQFALTCLFSLAVFFGCTNRDVSVELQYSATDVELIKQEIREFDWD